ncbi:MAG: hypothetical protein PVH87_07355 [Desulfobacteraceae bacterium]|jgi:hypothetical protein
MFEHSNLYFLFDVSEYFIDKIKSFKRLPEGWHLGEGTPPKKGTINEAVKIAEYAHNNFLLIDSAPGLEGEVQLVLYHEKNKDNKYIECTLEGDKTYNITAYEKRNNIWAITKDLNVESIKDIEKEIDNFVREIFLCQITSGSYPKNNIIVTLEDSQVSPLKTSGAEYQLSANHAFQTPEPQYATI